MLSCKKCGSVSLYTEIKNNNTGLYCKDCGVWVKWLNKEEIRVFQHQDKEEDNTEITKEKRIEDFIKELDKMIDYEYSKGFATDPTEAVHRSSYCLALEISKNRLINILRESKKDLNGDYKIKDLDV